jgi:hypothetical protein
VLPSFDVAVHVFLYLHLDCADVAPEGEVAVLLAVGEDVERLTARVDHACVQAEVAVAAAKINVSLLGGALQILKERERETINFS